MKSNKWMFYLAKDKSKITIYIHVEILECLNC